jgi:hypothetical protein
LVKLWKFSKIPIFYGSNHGKSSENPKFWWVKAWNISLFGWLKRKTPVIFFSPEAPARADGGGLCARWGDATDRDSRWGYHSGIMGI